VKFKEQLEKGGAIFNIFFIKLNILRGDLG